MYYSEHDREPDADASATLTHLVFVGGRLVDSWRESAYGTEWARHVRPAATAPPPPQPVPLHRQVTTWLEDVCGGPAALDALDDAPLTDDATDLPPEYAEPEARALMEGAAERLDSLAAQLFDAETSFAFRHALLAMWSEDAGQVLRASSPDHLATGIAWAVGKANGLFHPTGRVRVGTLQDLSGVRTPPSGLGRPVALTLRGFRGRPLDPARPWYGAPALEPLGRTDLLLGSTRRQLVQIRDRARADAA